MFFVYNDAHQVEENRVKYHLLKKVLLWIRQLRHFTVPSPKCVPKHSGIAFGGLLSVSLSHCNYTLEIYCISLFEK